MTDELQELREKLAIAEEVLKSIDTEKQTADLFVHLDFLYLRRTDFRWYAHRPCTGCDAKNAIADSDNAIDCIYIARQKLAAERAEAAKSEREKQLEDENKKLREALSKIASHWIGDRIAGEWMQKEARQALES